jgi:hypothetical protein
MPRHTTPPESSQSIPEMVVDQNREEMCQMIKDGKLAFLSEENRGV